MIGMRIARVRDKSMEPKLPKGSVVLFSSKRRPKRGDTVLAIHPDVGKVVQRVSAIGRKGGVYLSANSRRAGTDESIGRVELDDVLGVMVRRIA